MAIKWRTAAVVAATGLLASGCLLKKVEHTWYLEPLTGEVSWTVHETDVRSDAKTPADRMAEELEYWNAVQATTHPVAQGLREFGALDVRARILRDRVPYSVITDATFPTIDELGRRLVMLLGLAGTSVLERDGDVMQWTLSVRDPHAEEITVSDAVTALTSELDTLRVVLAEGRLESDAGFTLDSDSRVARIDDIDAESGELMIVLQLRWTTVSFPE
jgi:hypothetical protein